MIGEKDHLIKNKKKLALLANGLFLQPFIRALYTVVRKSFDTPIYRLVIKCSQLSYFLRLRLENSYTHPPR